MRRSGTGCLYGCQQDRDGYEKHSAWEKNLTTTAEEGAIFPLLFVYNNPLHCETIHSEGVVF